MTEITRPLPADPEVRAYIERVEAFYPPASTQTTVEQDRANYDALCTAFQGDRPAGVSVEDDRIVAEGPDRELAVRHYRSNSEGPEIQDVTLLYLHGGGFVVGGLDSHDTICADICARTGMHVMALDYRLAPEHIYPAALDDTESAYHHPHAQGRRIIVGGDSAGANLAAALCLRARRKGLPMPAGQVLVYPGLGDDFDTESHWRNEYAPMLERADCIHYLELYTGRSPASAAGDGEVCPLVASDYEGLPPAAVFSAGIDPLRDDAALFAQRLRAEGIPVRYHDEPELVHGYLRARRDSSLAAANFEKVCHALMWLAAGP